MERFDGHMQGVHGVRFSPDGKSPVSLGRAGVGQICSGNRTRVADAQARFAAGSGNLLAAMLTRTVPTKGHLADLACPVGRKSLRRRRRRKRKFDAHESDRKTPVRACTAKSALRG
jgi:hypothetical protein